MDLARLHAISLGVVLSMGCGVTQDPAGPEQSVAVSLALMGQECGPGNAHSCNATCATQAGQKCKKDPSWGLSTTCAGCCHGIAYPVSGQDDWSHCGTFIGYTAA